MQTHFHITGTKSKQLKVLIGMLLSLTIPVFSFATTSSTSSDLTVSVNKANKNSLEYLPSLSKQFPDINFNFYNTFIPYIYQSIKDVDTKTRLLQSFPQDNQNSFDSTDMSQPIIITADQIDSSDNGHTIVYSGNVEIRQGTRVLNANSVVYKYLDNGEQVISVDGKLSIKNSHFKIISKQSNINLNNHKVELDNIEYYLVNTFLHGEGNKLVYDNKKLINLDHFTLYSGVKSPISFNLKAKHALINSKDKNIKLQSVVYKIGQVPFFWLPSQTIQYGNQVIYPGLQKIQHKLGDLSKIQLAIPYLFKLTPNFTWLVTPRFFLSLDTNNLDSSLDLDENSFFHHLVLENRFNWANRFGLTSVNVNIAPKFFNKDFTYNGYYLSLSHNGSSDGFNYGLNINYINNPYYFKDYYFSGSNYLTNNLYVRNSGYNYNFSLEGIYYQPINGVDYYPYSVYPQITYEYYSPFSYNKFLYHTTNQYSYFVSPSFGYSYAHRIYSENDLSYSLLNKYFSTHVKVNTVSAIYNQFNQHSHQTVNVFKFTPEFKVLLESKLKFDNLWFNRYLVNLDFNLGYRYRHNYGYNIQATGLYDSGILPVSYLALQEGIYSYGVDRMYNLNQINFGFKFNTFDIDSGLEKLSGSLFYVQSLDFANKLDLNVVPKESLDTSYQPNKDIFQLANYKDILARIKWNFYHQFNFSGTTIVDVAHQDSYMGIAAINYQPTKTNILQFSYRYASNSYLKHKIQGYNSKENINQFGMSTIWDLSPSLSVLNSNYFDINNFKPIDTVIAFNFTSYGWYFGLMLERSRNGQNSYKNGIYFQAGIIGFNDDYNNHFSTFINNGDIPFVGNK